MKCEMVIEVSNIGKFWRVETQQTVCGIEASARGAGLTGRGEYVMRNTQAFSLGYHIAGFQPLPSSPCRENSTIPNFQTSSQEMASSSTSKMRVEFGGMAPG